MLRVYLDQMHWISLGKAYHNRPGGEEFKDVLNLALAGVERGLVSFPLSTAHYLEVAGVSDAGRRERLGEVMAQLSRFHAIGPQSAIQPSEIDEALRRRYGRPATVRPRQVFGVGVCHVQADDSLRPPLPVGVPQTSPEGVALLQAWERICLTQPPAFLRSTTDLRAHWKTCNEFQKVQDDYATFLAAKETTKPRRHHLLAVQALAGMVEPLAGALTAASISAQEIEANGIEGLKALLADIPTAHVDYEMWCLRHDNPERRWRRSDLMDVMAMNVAVPYCDVLATEKDAADAIRRARLDEVYQTKAISDLQDLLLILASA